LPITVRAEPSPDGGPPRLVASDASDDAMHATAFGALPLARDRSAAYAVAALAFEAELSWWEALRQAPGEARGPEVRLLAPVDPRRTPVLLVHGLASSPMTWANMVNELQGDPRIARHYQFWLLRYPTGQPLLYNRQALARTIAGFQAAAMPSATPGEPGMVAIGHSMGGVLARLLVTDSGGALWDAAFAVSPDALQGTEEDRRSARALFEFEALPGIDEVILIAAPHRGSARADGLLARLVRGVIAGPGHALDFLGRLAAANPSAVSASLGPSYLAGGPASLDTLAPSQPVSAAASRLPVVDGVRVHSIIGVRDPRHPERGDGVVALDSATWPQGSHYEVPGDHAVHAAPATVLLVKRLLLERLQREGEAASTPPGMD
jgi:pimeloyl-ACP methyl ester carboxylesterase